MAVSLKVTHTSGQLASDQYWLGFIVTHRQFKEEHGHAVDSLEIVSLGLSIAEGRRINGGFSFPVDLRNVPENRSNRATVSAYYLHLDDLAFAFAKYEFIEKIDFAIFRKDGRTLENLGDDTAIYFYVDGKEIKAPITRADAASGGLIRSFARLTQGKLSPDIGSIWVSEAVLPGGAAGLCNRLLTRLNAERKAELWPPSPPPPPPPPPPRPGDEKIDSPKISETIDRGDFRSKEGGGGKTSGSKSWVVAGLGALAVGLVIAYSRQQAAPPPPPENPAPVPVMLPPVPSPAPVSPRKRDVAASAANSDPSEFALPELPPPEPTVASASASAPEPAPFVAEVHSMDDVYRRGFGTHAEAVKNVLAAVLAKDAANYQQSMTWLTLNKVAPMLDPAGTKARTDFVTSAEARLKAATSMDEIKGVATELAQFLTQNFSLARAQQNLAFAWLRTNQPQYAAAAAFQAVVYNPAGGNSWVALGLTEAESGNLQDGAAALCVALRLSKYSSGFSEYMRQLEAGSPEYPFPNVREAVRRTREMCPYGFWQ